MKYVLNKKKVPRAYHTKDDYNGSGTLATQLLFDLQGVGFLFIDSSFYYYITTFTKTCHSVEYTVNSILTHNNTKVKRQTQQFRRKNDLS